MTADLIFVLALLGAAIVMFALDRPRMDAVALIVLCALPLSGVISMPEALAGFSDPNIVLIAALFVMGEGLVRTGVARRLGDWLVKRAGRSETQLIALLMFIVCLLGSAMSSTAVTAIFIPVALRISRSTGIPPSRLMMPLSVAALISGMTTLIATAPNLVVHSELVRHGERGFAFFSFTPFGVPILLLGIGYMLIARHWLPATTANGLANNRSDRPRLSDWFDRYKLAGREHRVRVRANSPLVDSTLETAGLRGGSGANVIAIHRDQALILPTARTVLKAGDILLVDLFAPLTDIESLRAIHQLEPLPIDGGYFIDQAQEIGMAEAIVPADSEIVGKTVAEAGFRGRFGLTVIGLRRGVHALEQGLKDEQLRIGDTLLVIGPWKAIRQLRVDSRDLVVLSLPLEHDDVHPVAGKVPHALFALALMIALMVFGILPNVQAALLGCLLMGALGCVDFESAYRSIDWKTLVLIVGMLPFSIALERTGGVDAAAQALRDVTGDASPRVVLALLFATTAVLGMFISNTATAVLMAPVALSIAGELGLSPYPFAMIVALAASSAFMTPVSSPVNTLVVTPGGYRFGDFVRVGVPFTLIVAAVCVWLVPWLLPP